LRPLLIGALAICLVGCSRQSPPELALASCAGPNARACFDRWGETAPSRPTDAAIDIRPSVAVKAVRAPFAQVRHRPHLTHEAKPAVTPAKAEPVASRASAPRDASTARPQPERSAVVAATSPVPEPKAGSNETFAGSAQYREQQSELAAFQSSSAGNPERLVAILMARPDIGSIADLGGKMIAIDDRYSVPASTVRTAIVAAGAPQAQLSEGQGTAMNRLSNGEVPAAVVALVTPEAADKFPEFLGYRIFQVPLSPYAFRARP
jgi:hypothetical protein